MVDELTLLEGKWFPRKHVSVRELFVPLFAIWKANSECSYHYEQFTNGEAFCAAIKHAFGNHRAKSIYIGAHGDARGIQGFHDDGISRTVIRNALNEREGTTKRGIYFGSCEFGNEENAEFLLGGCDRLEWMAGYEKSVDWIDSMALDLVFFRHFLFPSPGKGGVMPHTTCDKLRYTGNRICNDMGSLAKRLGFHIFVRRRGGGIEDILDVGIDEDNP